MDKPKSCKDGCPPFQTCDFCAGKPDDLVKRLRKQFSIDRILENPGFVAAVYVNERDHAADIIEDQQKRIEKLEAALRDLINDWDFWQSQETRSGFSELFASVCELRAALGEKK